MDLATFLIQCLNAVQYGLLLFLVASGLTLIFGIMGVINLAHGSFYMIGAYMAYALAPWVGDIGGGFFITLVVGLLLSIAFGYLLEWSFFSFLYEREHLQQVLMTYGLILVFEELRSIIVGDDVHGVAAPAWLSGSVPLGDVMTYPTYRLFISAVCVAVAGTVLCARAHAARNDPRRREQSGDGPSDGRQHQVPVSRRVCCRRCAGGARRNDRGGVFGVSEHGWAGADHQLRRRGDWRHRFGSRRTARFIAGWPGRYVRQGVLSGGAGVLVYLLMAVILLWKPEGLFRLG